jgi:hypothetical protein
LPAGEYFVFALPGSDVYLPEFYDGARLISAATAVSVTPPNTTDHINFTLDKGASIEGFVYLQRTYPAGADTLYDFPVVAYDATTGIAMGAADVTFSGGYRIENLPPGNYKVQALPLVSPFAVTYFGGGATFSDPKTTAVSVGQDEIKEANIELGRGQETISGHVFAEMDGNQTALPNALVLAYDATGHAVSAGMSGVLLPAMTPQADSSAYTIANLRAGNYTVRTFSAISALERLGNLLDNMDNGNEAVAPGTGLGDGIPGIPLIGDLNFSITLYQDEWYNDVPVQINPAQTGMDLMWSILTSKGDVTSFIPLFDQVPTGASVVTSGSTNIDFVLGKLNPKDVFSDVQQCGSSLPKAFALEQSYPNPVHLNTLISSGTIIAYSLKNPAPVSVVIYNVLGQKVAELVNRVQAAGVHRALWNGKDMSGHLVANGIYFYELKVQNRRIDLKKMVILR